MQSMSRVPQLNECLGLNSIGRRWFDGWHLGRSMCVTIPRSVLHSKNFVVFGTGTLPFMIGATIAFSSGIAMYYRSCLSQALLSLEKYPHLLLLHLDANYPAQRWNMSRVTALLDERDSEWIQKSMLVTAWQSAGAALDVSLWPWRLGLGDS